MATEAYWKENKLYFRTRTGKVRHIANYAPSKYHSLETFHNGSTYFVGRGNSSVLKKEVETYWSRADGATYLIHFDNASGDTMVRPDTSVSTYTCQR